MLLSLDHNLDPQYYEIRATNRVQRQIALRIRLVPPGYLKANDVSVTIILAMDTVLADEGDHDFRCGISDNISFVGYSIPDEDNYNSFSPCGQFEADKGNGILLNIETVSTPRISSNHYSAEIKMQFRPAEQWGSCDTEHVEGYINIANYG